MPGHELVDAAYNAGEAPDPTESSPALFGSAPVEGLAAVAGFDGGSITSNAGALLLGVTDSAIGQVRRIASCFRDVRLPERVEHEVAAVPHGHWKTSTLVAGLRADGIVVPLVLDCAINGTSFRAYVEQFLAPSLRPGDTVAIANFGGHKVNAPAERLNSVRPNAPASRDCRPVSSPSHANSEPDQAATDIADLPTREQKQRVR